VGLLDLAQRSWTLVGGSELDGIPTYLFSEKAPGLRGGAADAITDWVAVDDGTLLRREIRASDDELRKTVVYDSISEVEGIFVPSFSRIADRRAGGTTDLHVRDVRFDVHVPKSLFDPRRISELAEHPAWSHLSEPTFEVVEPEAD
jgi:outer membrane lipoprotein-sorting protein